jgi:hypothetical protein
MAEVAIVVICEEGKAIGKKLQSALFRTGVAYKLLDGPDHPGVKFKKVENFPFVVTVGPKGLEAGLVELRQKVQGKFEFTQLHPEKVVRAILQTGELNP